MAFLSRLALSLLLLCTASGRAQAEEPAKMPQSAQSIRFPDASLLGAAGCGDGFTLDRLMKNLSSGKFGDKASGVFYQIADVAVDYYAEKAFVQGDPAPCQRLAGQQVAAQSATRDCLEKYYFLAFAQSMFAGDRNLGKVCRKFVGNQHGPFFRFDQPQADDLCAAIELDRKDPKVLCAKISPKYLREDRIPACEAEFGRYDFAKDEPCVGTHGEPGNLIQRCEGLAAYRKAHKAGSAAACGDYEFCKVLMGEGVKRMQSHAAKVKENVCGAVVAGQPH